jgi:Ca2+/Na+ antiporter
LDRHTLYLITLTALITIAISTLTALNEYRLDVYISIITLIYFTTSAIFRPKKRTKDFLALTLLIIFSYFIALRIIEVLYP